MPMMAMGIVAVAASECPFVPFVIAMMDSSTSKPLKEVEANEGLTLPAVQASEE
jgi:hypothetical protein